MQSLKIFMQHALKQLQETKAKYRHQPIQMIGEWTEQLDPQGGYETLMTYVNQLIFHSNARISIAKALEESG